MYVKNNACVQVWIICVVGKLVVRVGPFFTGCPRIAESIDIRHNLPGASLMGLIVYSCTLRLEELA